MIPMVIKMQLLDLEQLKTNHREMGLVRRSATHSNVAVGPFAFRCVWGQ